MVKSHATSKVKLASIAKSSEGSSDISADTLRSQFTSAAIGMSWQLMIIVLIPIVGGYKLDQVFDKTPLFTLIGLGIALVGSIIIIKRAVRVFSTIETVEPKDKTVINHKETL